MKTYQKPQLFYEKFELSQHIASCDWIPNSTLGIESPCTTKGSLYGVSYEHGFVEGTCEQGVQGYCYTNSIGIMGLHTS